ncbi:MAG: dihydroneopterin aldolase [Candidatus Micrarchaeota archaeon]|nr:dihydroneopterin aldolase [Candidatus Micrarchaeota archaeon]
MKNNNVQKIIIKNLRTKCIIGVNPDERRRKQDVIINLTMWMPLSKAIKSDNIEDTVNYGTVNKKVKVFAENSRFRLIEALAGGIAGICMEEKNLRKLKVRVEKPHALSSAESAGVEIVRCRN